MGWLWVDGRRFLPLVYGRSGMVTSSEQTAPPGNAGFVMDPCLDQRQLIKLHLPASYIKYQSCEPAFRHAETFRFRRLITLYLCWAATSRSYFHRSQVLRIARILSLWHCDGSSARMNFFPLWVCFILLISAPIDERRHDTLGQGYWNLVDSDSVWKAGSTQCVPYRLSFLWRRDF